MVYLGLNILRVLYLLTHSYMLIKDGYYRRAESEARLPCYIMRYQSDCPPSVLNHVIDAGAQDSLCSDNRGAFNFLFLCCRSVSTLILLLHSIIP